MVQRKFYSLVFEGLGPDINLEIQTLSRGEVFNIYLELGYPEQAIVDTDKMSRARFEDEVYHLAVSAGLTAIFQPVLSLRPPSRSCCTRGSWKTASIKRT